MLSLLLAALLSTTAHAEKCPLYDGKRPEVVVDVKEFKFFYFQRAGSTTDPNIILVEKDGQITDTQKVAFWADDMADSADFYGKNIDISCTYNFDFVSARYSSPEGRVYDYMNGDCRADTSPTHRLTCD